MEEIKERIKQHEGFRDTVYSDSLGFATIGFGHLVLPSDNFVEGVAYDKETLEEVFEATTWTKLKLHTKYKRVLLLDNNGFWADFIDLLDQITSSGFIKTEDREIISRTTSVATLISSFQNC